MTNLAETLSTALEAKAAKPNVVYRDNIPTEITIPSAPEANNSAEYLALVQDLGVPIPEGYELQLVEATKNQNAWTRDSADQELAVTKPNWRYRFKVVQISRMMSAADVEAFAAAALAVRPHKPVKRAANGSCYIVGLADFQVGKGSNGNGGTDALIERFSKQLGQIIADFKASGASSILIADLGDNSCENEHNSAAQLGTNDLQFIAQLRVWNRLLMKITVELAKVCDDVTVAGVASNHGQHRHNGKAVGDASNDYGLLALSTLQDALGLNPKAFGHVKFAFPEQHKETLTVHVGGTNVGLAHGHQSGSPDKVPDFIMKQIAGRQPLQYADIILSGHFHHLRVQAVIGNRTWIQGPANDAGSVWFTNKSGEFSDAGILTLSVLDGKWGQLKVV